MSLIGLVGVVVGGVFAGKQYLDSLHKDRVTQAMEYVKRYHEAEMMTARSTLTLNMGAVIETVTAADTNASIAERFRKNNSLLVSMTSLLNFYEEVETCVRSNLCDRATVISLFGNDAKGFFSFAYPYVCAERDRWKSANLYRASETFFRPDAPLCSD